MKILAAALGALAVLSGAARAEERLDVVELYQSQGCSSCPPTNANVIALADRPDVLALSFAVTYWDYLGWKDTFAKPAFTQRQRDYAGVLGSGSYTPEVVVNGRADLVGANRAELERAIRRNARPPFEPAITTSARTVTIAAAQTTAAGDVWLVWYDPRTVEVPIRRGENSGRTLPHRNVVHDIRRIGAWSGQAATFNVPAPPDPALRAAILVQRRNGGPIIAAARLGG